MPLEEATGITVPVEVANLGAVARWKWRCPHLLDEKEMCKTVERQQNSLFVFTVGCSCSFYIIDQL